MGHQFPLGVEGLNLTISHYKEKLQSWLIFDWVFDLQLQFGSSKLKFILLNVVGGNVNSQLCWISLEYGKDNLSKKTC